MKNIIEFGTKALKLAKLYPVSFYTGFKNRKLFEGVEAFCMFIGYPRSGTSIVGSLLDAHPNIVIAHELDTLKYVYAKFHRYQIYHLLLENSRRYGKNNRTSLSYSHGVPNQWQGTFDTIRIIGDKHAEAATYRFQLTPRLLKRLKDVIGRPIKFIHITRNPYDCIKTISLKKKLGKQYVTLKESADYFFSLCDTVAQLKQQIKKEDLFELRNEAFIDNPELHLNALCQFLGLDTTKDYLNDCASIVFKAPHLSRHEVNWPKELIDRIDIRMQRFPFLQGYRFDE